MSPVNRIIVWDDPRAVIVIPHLVSPRKVALGWTFEEDRHPPSDPRFLLDTFVTRFNSSRVLKCGPSYLKHLAYCHGKQLEVAEHVL